MLHFKIVQYLTKKGVIYSGCRILDIGTQNILFLNKPDVLLWISGLRRQPVSAVDELEIDRICYFSTPRPGERTAFFHELLALTDVQYESVDIVNGGKTTILDLNRDPLPVGWNGGFDLVLNCGTLEHVINQYHALDFIHSALRVGGYWFDQPPCVGFMNHGYFNYNPVFYHDVARSNRYGVCAVWYSAAGYYPLLDPRVPVVSVDELDTLDDDAHVDENGDLDDADVVPSLSYNFNCLMRKCVDEAFRLPLEIRTTHGAVGSDVVKRYENAVFSLHNDDGFHFNVTDGEMPYGDLDAGAATDFEGRIESRLLEVKEKLSGWDGHLYIYGAGLHSRLMISVWRRLELPEVVCVVQTQSPEITDSFVEGLALRGIADVSIGCGDLVILSSKSFEYDMAKLCSSLSCPPSIYSIWDPSLTKWNCGF
jgi:hypothetical protein